MKKKKLNFIKTAVVNLELMQSEGRWYPVSEAS